MSIKTVGMRITTGKSSPTMQNNLHLINQASSASLYWSRIGLQTVRWSGLSYSMQSSNRCLKIVKISDSTILKVNNCLNKLYVETKGKFTNCYRQWDRFVQFALLHSDIGAYWQPLTKKPFSLSIYTYLQNLFIHHDV